MKKAIMIGILAIGSIVMAESAQDVLRKAREDYYKEQKEALKPKKEEKVTKKEEKKAEKKMHKEMKKNEEMMGNTEEVMEEEKVEEVKPRTAMEKLEYNAAKAKDKVDFYERVVRSVEREEKELNGYNEVIGKKKVKKAPKQMKEKKEIKKKK